jgi:hypothetical protein
MENNFRIFTESKADVKFLKDYIKSVFTYKIEDNSFDTLGSWSGYKKGGVLNTSIKQNFDDGNKTVLILDADKDYENRRNEVLSDFIYYNIPIELFLFPDNKQNGNLEYLLSQIATERKMMDCFLEYEKCVSGHSKPLNDARIYSYLDMLLYPNPFDTQKKDLRKEENRNYGNQNHWNLHHEALLSLKQFLSTLF